MPPTFGWDNFEDIAIGLADKFPDTDPLTVRFTDMHKWILELPGFSGDPAASNEAKLEAIQMAWQEEFHTFPNCTDTLLCATRSPFLFGITSVKIVLPLG